MCLRNFFFVLDRSSILKYALLDICNPPIFYWRILNPQILKLRITNPRVPELLFKVSYHAEQLSIEIVNYQLSTVHFQQFLPVCTILLFRIHTL